MRVVIALAMAGTSMAWGQLIVPARGRFIYPTISMAASETNCILNEASNLDVCAEIFRIPVTSSGNGLESVRIQTSSVTSAQSITVSLQTVSTSDGYPTGTPAWTNSSCDIASPSGTGAFLECNLTAASAVTMDTLLAMAVAFTGTAGNLSLSMGNAQQIQDRYGAIQNSGTWAKSSATKSAWAVKIDGTWYPLNRFGSSGAQFSSGSIGTTYYGNRFVAADWTGRAIGVVVSGNFAASSGITAHVYNSAHTELAASAEVDTDTTHGAAFGSVYIPFTTPLMIVKGQQYDVLINRSSGSGTEAIYYVKVSDAASGGMWEYGTNIYGLTWDGSTTWTTQTSFRYGVHLVFDGMFAGGAIGGVSQ